MKSVLELLQSTHTEAGVQIGADTVVSKGYSVVYGETGHNIFDVPFDERVKTEFFTDDNIVTQEITLADGETIHAYCASAVDAGGSSPFGYNNFEVDLEIFVLDTTTTAFDGSNLGNLSTLLYEDGSTDGLSDLWSDGTDFTNTTGSDMKVVIAICYYGALDTSTEGLTGLSAYLYLSKLRDPYTVPLPLEVEATSFTAPVLASYISAGNSFAAGKGLISQWTGSTALGKYNIGSDANNILEIGGGTSDVARSNLLEITTSGDLVLPTQPDTLTPNSVATKALLDTYNDVTNSKLADNPDLGMETTSTADNSHRVVTNGTKIVTCNNSQVFIRDMDGSNLITIPKPATANGNESFGDTVAISGTKIVVGCPYSFSSGTEPGAVYIYNLDGTGELRITPSVISNQFFGEAVAVTSTKIIVGAHANSQAPGTVYTYNLDGTGEIITRPASGTVLGYGNSIAATETKMIVGAIYNDRAYISNLDGSDEVELFPSDNPTGLYEPKFGCSVAISDTHAVVGAVNTWAGDISTGAAYIYDIDGSNESKSLGEASANYGRYGESVALQDNMCIVSDTRYDITIDGAITYNAGAIYIKQIDGSHTYRYTNESRFTGNAAYGTSIALLGTDLLVIAAGQDKVYRHKLGYKWSTEDVTHNGELLTSVITGLETSIADTVNTAYLLSAEFGNSLPTTDPLAAGKLWSNLGILTVSAG